MNARINATPAAASLKPAPMFRTITRDQIAPSQTHIQQMRRARFDMPALTDLAANIRAMGILQPIVVRPVANANIPYEIVAGERRYIAAGLADLDTVPVSVVDITDEEALEMQLVENLQREGLHDLEEAEGYAELMRARGLNADQIGEKIGKSRSYVYSKLKYQQLSDDARAAFYAGSIDASKALLLARISNPKQQAKALKHFTTTQWNGETPSYRACLAWVRDEMAVAMMYIPFALSADDLPGHRVDHLGHSAKALTTLPACSGCDYFIDAGTERETRTCLQPACFKQKTKAGIERILEESRQAGHTVVTDREVNLHQLIDLDDVPEANTDENDHRTLREILEGNLPEIITVHMLSRDRVTHCVRLRDAIPAAQQAGIQFEEWFTDRHADRAELLESGEDNDPDDAAWRAAQAKAQAAQYRKERLETQYRRALFRAVWAKWKGPMKRDELIALAEDRLQDFDDLILELVTGTTDTSVDIDLDKLKDDELLRLLAMSTLQRCLWHGSEPNDLTAMARRFRIDPVKVKKTVQAEMKAAEKAAKTQDEE